MAQKDLKKPVQRLWSLLQAERRDILNIYFYALFNGLLMLSVPLGIQAIINFIQSGSTTASWVVLVVLVLVGLGIAGVFQIFQLGIAERIQQRLFVNSSIDFSYRIPRLHLDALRSNYPPELINRFFDVMTVQKGLYKLLFDFSIASLQILFGLILLSLYHPFFIAMGLLLVLLVYFFFRFTSKGGLRTALEESDQKYAVVSWLEEQARSLISFKMTGGSPLPMDRTDKLNMKYLKSRQSHFKILVRQYSILIVFKILITGSLLFLGGLLVFEQQMNIGQFVAAEIVIVQIINSVEKLIYSIETIYDVLAGIEKVGIVTDLRLESNASEDQPQEELDPKTPLEIELKNLTLQSSLWDEPILQGLNIHVLQGTKVGLCGHSGAGKSATMQVMAGLHTDFKGNLYFNKRRFSNIAPHSLRRITGDNLQSEDIFDGTLWDNISMGRPDVTRDQVNKVIEQMGLQRLVDKLSHGVHTPLPSSGIGLPSGIRQRIILARSLVGTRRLLLMEDRGAAAGNYWLDPMMEQQDLTLVLASNERRLLKHMDYIYVLDQGRVIDEGSYEELEDRLPC